MIRNFIKKNALNTIIYHKIRLFFLEDAFLICGKRLDQRSTLMEHRWHGLNRSASGRTCLTRISSYLRLSVTSMLSAFFIYGTRMTRIEQIRQWSDMSYTD